MVLLINLWVLAQHRGKTVQEGRQFLNYTSHFYKKEHTPVGLWSSKRWCELKIKLKKVQKKSWVMVRQASKKVGKFPRKQNEETETNC